MGVIRGRNHQYLDTGEPFDKAGAYGIQGFGSVLVKKITGDYFAVVGLPVSRTMRELKKAGFDRFISITSQLMIFSRIGKELINCRQNTLMIRDFPKDERPRERFIQNGPESLSNHELVALMLRTGTKEESVLQLSNRLLTHFEGLRLLKDATLDEITSIKGIGAAKAIQVLSCC